MLNQSQTNMNWNCNSQLQNNKPNLNPIAAKMAIKRSGKLKNS
jgi:hypothetical protein